MDATTHHDGSDTEAWQRSSIGKFRKEDMYTTSGVLDDNAPDQTGIVSSTYVRGGKIHSPQTGKRGPGALAPTGRPSRRATWSSYSSGGRATPLSSRLSTRVGRQPGRSASSARTRTS